MSVFFAVSFLYFIEITEDAVIFTLFLTDHLRQRQHDPDENVRIEVVQAIVNAAKKEFSHVSDDLLECVKERTLDKKVSPDQSGSSICSYQSILSRAVQDPQRSIDGSGADLSSMCHQG